MPFRNSNIKQLIEKREPLPANSRELLRLVESSKIKGELAQKHGVLAPVVIKSFDVSINLSLGGSGYGDPIERDPELVREDLIKGKTTAVVAREIYCVAAHYDETEKEWKIDYKETENLRDTMRNKRLQTGRPVSSWWEEERNRISNKEFAPEVNEMYRECMGLSQKFAREFREFWKLPEDFAFR